MTNDCSSSYRTNANFSAEEPAAINQNKGSGGSADSDWHDWFTQHPMRPNEIMAIIFSVPALLFAAWAYNPALIASIVAVLGDAYYSAMKIPVLKAVLVYLYTFGRKETTNAHKAAGEFIQKKVEKNIAPRKKKGGDGEKSTTQPQA